MTRKYYERDLAYLALIESFVQDAPQLMLQLYILLVRHPDQLLHTQTAVAQLAGKCGALPPLPLPLPGVLRPGQQVGGPRHAPAAAARPPRRLDLAALHASQQDVRLLHVPHGVPLSVLHLSWPSLFTDGERLRKSYARIKFLFLQLAYLGSLHEDKLLWLD